MVLLERLTPLEGLSWPGRYSHSPGEVLNLRDLERPGQLIRKVGTCSPPASVTSFLEAS
jgi:hypothetical protein